MNNWTRRRVLQTVLTGGAVLVLARFVSAEEPVQVNTEAAKVPELSIELFNTHTRETVKAVYKRGDEYDVEALAQFKKLLRDHRNGESHDMDPRLYDQLHALALAANREPYYEIISGYRSQESNDKMSSKPGSGVAKKSLHMQGRAIDVRLKNYDCAKLRDLALAAKKGGVGYYQRSNFVHIDTGSFRTWVGQ
jgi:uncharacterized protein YcbK (DUF882 family)